MTNEELKKNSRRKGKMTDEQILNALKSCGDSIAICDDCPYEGRNHCSLLAKQDIIERFNALKAENASLRAELEDYKIEERRAERISKYRREDARRVADKITRCCLAHCGHKVRIEAQDGFWIETCTYPPYHGKWIVEIEKCPKAEEAQKSAEARLAELKGEKK